MTFLDETTPLAELPEGQKNILRTYAPEVMKFMEENPTADEKDLELSLIRNQLAILQEREKKLLKEKGVK